MRVITFDDLATTLEYEVKFTDIIKHLKLLCETVQPTEKIKFDIDGEPLEHELNEPHKVWEWLQIVANMAAEVNGYCEEDYKELMECNWEEA